MRNAVRVSTLGASWLALLASAVVTVEAETRPNVLIIVTDDQRADLMSVMPQTLQLFGEQGVAYPNGFANTPLCCPARASIFAGRFAHNHGVRTNAGADPLDHATTVQRHLQGAGYSTGIVGKYFNAWDVRRDPPFFDRWAITTNHAHDSGTYNVDGGVVSVNQYSTDYIGDTSDGLIRDFEVQDETPWFLHVAPTKPHLPVSVAPEYQDAPVEPWEPPPSASGTPDPEVTDGVRRMLMSVDDLVGQLFQTLEELGETEDTLAFFTSDNGFMWGEHGLWAKNKPYTESIRVPFFARWPGHLPAGHLEGTPVAHVDLAPTILGAAGIDVPPAMDGVSLLGETSRTDMLTEAWHEDGILSWASLRTASYQYIEWFTSDLAVKSRAFYRLDEDPWQQVNVAESPRAGGPDTNALHAALGEAMACEGTTGPMGCEAALTLTTLEIHDAAGSEGAGQLTFEVTLSRATVDDVHLPYATRDGTARAPADYGAVSGTLVIPAGETSGEIVVPVVADTLDEPDESVFIDLSPAVNAAVIDSSATGTIIDDDPPPAISISDASAKEGDDAITFPVTLSAASSRRVSVKYATANGTAMAAEDFVQTAGVLEFRAGQTSAGIAVPLLDDTVAEADETFTMQLSEPQEATSADADAVATIVDDDTPPLTVPEISVTDASAGEAEPSMTFTVTLSAASSTDVTVAYATASGTARAGKDYNGKTGTLTIPAGQTARTIPVRLLNDSIEEPEETFFLKLSSPSGATIADGEAVGTILDDDP